MKQWLAVAVVSFAIILSITAIYFSKYPADTRNLPASSPWQTASGEPAGVLPLKSPEIGIFYYLWYGAPDSHNWASPKFVDYPWLGNYSSDNATVIELHLRWIQDMNVDFVVLSWWGFNDAYGRFIDNASKQVFELAEANNSTLKFAIMVEPFNCTDGAYYYAGIYDYVYDEFVVPHKSLYYNEEKPLICFYNDANLTKNGFVPADSRFTTILVGQEPYAQWIYTNLNIYCKPQLIPYTNQVSVTLRYDDSRVRIPNCTVNGDLGQQTIDYEWSQAINLWKNGTVNTILITSWNEYVERTAIEPHYDGTASRTNPYLLYNLTKAYIAQVHSVG
jgi:hypothetical protein